MTFRIMAIQEEGSEICLGSGIATSEEAYAKLPELRETYVELRQFWVEEERDYYAEAAQAAWEDGYAYDEQDEY